MTRFPYSEDLLDVGMSKALGYLPLNTIEHYGGESATNDLIMWAYQNKNEAKVFITGNVGSGALYVWNVKMLKEILARYHDVLVSAGVPVDDCETYVWHIQHHLVHSQTHPEAYMVVGLTFNDARFRGKDLKDAKKLSE